MSHWNHRVVKQKLEDGSEWFSVREVFYNDDGSIYAYTESPVDISGESIEAMKEYCQWILNCLDKDILVDGEVTFVDDEAVEQRLQADMACACPLDEFGMYQMPALPDGTCPTCRKPYR